MDPNRLNPPLPGFYPPPFPDTRQPQSPPLGRAPHNPLRYTGHPPNSTDPRSPQAPPPGYPMSMNVGSRDDARSHLSFPQARPHQHSRPPTESHQPLYQPYHLSRSSTVAAYAPAQHVHEHYPSHPGSYGQTYNEVLSDGRSDTHTEGLRRDHEQPEMRATANVGDESDIRYRGGPNGPVVGRARSCGIPKCNRPLFLDQRVGLWRDWCSEEHMHEAVVRNIEKQCKQCGVWPRKRGGYKLCSGDHCGNPNGVYRT
ncbi:hypothetical protein BC834DRAFT_900804 [Gloeopeniophorella convolvens]|nr:hypothetical protein BC834DRAFT_900804 [Gloeopeniophorella convolvens]